MTDTNISKPLRRLCNSCGKVLKKHNGVQLTMCAAALYLRQSIPWKYESFNITSSANTSEDM